MQTSRRVSGCRRSRVGFTLVELLVVMAIIGLLAAMLFPAIQSARESARQTTCRSNLDSLGIATNAFATNTGAYPPSWKPTVPDASGNVNGWSAQALLLPYLDAGNLFEGINFDQSYSVASNVVTADGVSRKLSSIRNPTLLCPAEVRDEVRFSGGVAEHYPLNYAINCGVWFVWDPATRVGGSGTSFPGSKVTPDHIKDGQSNTLAFAEVKGWTPYYRNAAGSSLSLPTSVSGVCTLAGTFKSNSGHTEWVDGRVHQAGFTTVFPPNTKVPCTNSGVAYDVDWTNQQEGKSGTIATYAAVTSRSYHPGKVQVVLLDGSVRTIDNSINAGVWRALSTRAGKEVLPQSFHRN